MKHLKLKFVGISLLITAVLGSCTTANREVDVKGGMSVTIEVSKEPLT
ncbi:MAG: hypothetical protein HRT57_07210 [Crocinitomicaceae bacterium]|nr:hypothetical protein [Crocinitomicaceae bacterium]